MDAGDSSLVFFGPIFGGFGFWSVSVGLFTDVDSLRGATEGLRTGDGAEDRSSVLLGGSLGGFGF